jgi:hypothetical protein
MFNFDLGYLWCFFCPLRPNPQFIPVFCLTLFAGTAGVCNRHQLRQKRKCYETIVLSQVSESKLIMRCSKMCHVSGFSKDSNRDCTAVVWLSVVYSSLTELQKSFGFLKQGSLKVPQTRAGPYEWSCQRTENGCLRLRKSLQCISSLTASNGLCRFRRTNWDSRLTWSRKRLVHNEAGSK